LLHARAAGCGHGEQGGATLDRGLERADVTLADGASHRAAEKREVHHGELERIAVERAGSDDDRFTETGVELRFRQALDVRPQVEEVEWVRGANVLGLLDERA